MPVLVATRPLVRLGVLVTAVAVLCACGSSGPVEVTEFRVTSAEGRFSVVFPRQPETGMTEADQTEGTRKVTSMMASSGSDDFGVTWSDFPASFLAGGAGPVLEKVRNKVVEDIKGALVSSEEITLDGHPGLDVEARVDEGATAGQYLARFYLVQNRIYEVLVIRNDTKADDTPVLDFFESFTLTGS